MFPDATSYGTARHRRLAAPLRWAPETTDNDAFAARYADDFDFLVPRGVDFIPDNENLHFASVLAIHRSSKTLRVPRARARPTSISTRIDFSRDWLATSACSPTTTAARTSSASRTTSSRTPKACRQRLDQQRDRIVGRGDARLVGLHELKDALDHQKCQAVCSSPDQSIQIRCA